MPDQQYPPQFSWPDALERIRRLESNYLLLQKENDQIRIECEELQKDNRRLKSAGRATVAGPLASTPASTVSVSPGQYEEAMVAALNEWWQDEKPDRQGLLELLRRLGVPAKFYTMNAIESSMQTVSWNGPYSLQPSEKDGGWLWCGQTGGEALLLPADPAFFETATMQKILQRIIIGCENLNGKPDFQSAYHACHLGPSDKEGWFRVNGKGVVWIKGQTKPQGYDQVRIFDSFFAPAAGRQASPAVPTQAPSSRNASLEEIRALMENALAPVLTVLNTIKGEMDSVRREIGKVKAAPVRPPDVPGADERAPEVPPPSPLAQDALKRAYSDAITSTHGNYVARLRALQETLQSRFSDLKFEVSHLSLQASKIAMHRTRIEEADSIACEICAANPGERQFFLTAPAGRPDAVWVLLPPGDFNKFDFPIGYGLLLDPAPPNSFNVDCVTQPALLIQCDAKGGLYQVSRKMSCERAMRGENVG